MTDFVRGACPIWLLDDLTGNLLDDTYYVFFLENTLPYLPQGVYRDFSATVPWDNPLQVQADGTLPNNLYFDPDAVYRIEIRHGNTQADALIRLVENYVPLGAEPTPVDDTNAHVENLMTNPQFFDVNFQTDVTFQTTSTITQIAPGWEIEKTAGVTTVTVAQLSFPGDNNVATNASYAISITSAGTGTIILRQKFDNTGGLFASGAVTLALTAAYSGTVVDLHAELVYSAGTAPTEIFNPVKTLTTTLTEYTGHSDVPVSANPDTAADAYTALELSWAAGATVKITSVQLVATPSGSTQEISYQQTPLERQVDHEFHYYKSQLIQKPIPSWLVGWDFPLNPLQFNGNGTVAAQAIGANKSFYAWDQTIVFQSVNSGVSISRSTGGSFVMTSTSVSPATGQVGIIQYLDRAHILPLLHDSVSVNIAAYTSAASAVTASVELYYTEDANLPAMGSNNSIVSSLNSDGSVNSTNGTWVKIPRINNLGTATFKIQPKVTEEFFDYHFNGWDLEGISATNTATYFAIVIGTEGISSPTTISFLSVGLCSGEVPTRPAPQTADQVLQECQRYYESSYPAGVAPATASQASAIFRLQYGVDTGAQRRGYSRSFGVEYKTQKRKTPNFEIYNDNTGASNEVSPWQNVTGATATRLAGVTFLNVATPSSGNWILKGSDTKQIFYAVENSVAFFGVITADPAPEAFITFHYTADSRLGIVN